MAPGTGERPVLTTPHEPPPPWPAAAFQRRSLFQLCWPLFVYAFLAILNSFIDQLMMSAYAQNLAAAVSMANQILGLAYDFSGLLGVGALILIAQFLGAGKIEEARSVAGTAIVANTLVGGLLAAILLIGGRHFVVWVNTPPEIVEDTLFYVRVIGLAMIGNGFLMAAAAVLRGFGHTLEILWLGMLANVLYLPLQYVLIFGRFGFPEMGVKGAALSTLIIRIISVFVLLYLLRRRLGITLVLRESFRRTVDRIRPLVPLSLPSVGENLAQNLHQLLMVSFLAASGVAALLTRSYVLTLTAFVSLIVTTISQGNEVLIGYDQGAGQHRVARRRGTLTAVGTALLNLVPSFGLYLFSDVLMGLFTKDPAVLAEAKTLLLINLLLQPFQSISLILFNALRAVGDVWVPVGLSILVTWGLALPLGWLVVARGGYGTAGFWWVLVAAELIKSALLFHRWHGLRWTRHAALAKPV